MRLAKDFLMNNSLNKLPALEIWGGPQDIALRFASSAATQSLVRFAGNLQNVPTPSMLTTVVLNENKPIEELLYDALAAAKIYTSQVAMHMDRLWRDKLFKQLDSLLDQEEWVEEDVPLQRASFATFLKIMFLFKPGKRPGLGLSVTGNLIGAWTEGDRQLTIECLANDVVRYVFSHPVDGHIERTAGETTVPRLCAVLAPYEVAAWLKSKQDH